MTELGEKIAKAVGVMKEQNPTWKGKIFPDDPKPGWTHVHAHRLHPEYGEEQIDLFWEGNSMNRPPEYTRAGVTIIERNSAEIVRRMRGEPTKTKGRVKRDNNIENTPKDRPIAIRKRKPDVPVVDGPKFRIPPQEELEFGPDDDDGTILEYVCSAKKIIVASTIAPDFPPTEHVVGFDRLTPPKVVRLSDGRVNVDYVSEEGTGGFRSLRVNNILAVR